MGIQMSSIVALNAGSIKIKEMSSYGSSSSLDVASNINITGNLTVGNELLVLSSVESTSKSTGGFTVDGGLGIKKNLNIGSNLNVSQGALYVNRNGSIQTTRVGIGTETPRCSLDIVATDGIIIPGGTNSDRANISNPVDGMIRYNTQDNYFEGYSQGNWSILGGARSADKRTYIDPEEFADENVLRFGTSGRQRMAIFNGNGNDFGQISNSQGNGGTVGGMLGGIAVGFDFNRPEASFHVKGNMIVSSNVNITGDYIKLYATNNQADSIKLLSVNGGMTLDLNKSLNETISENRTSIVSGNLVETVVGTKNTTIKGAVDETYNSTRNITISGTVTQT